MISKVLQRFHLGCWMEVCTSTARFTAAAASSQDRLLRKFGYSDTTSIIIIVIWQ